MKYFRKTLAIDFGTSKVVTFVENKGIIVNEPSVVTMDTYKNKILSYGETVKKLLGRIPGNVATGSLKNVRENERAKGMVLSRGDTLTEGEDIERRAEEIGLYSGVVVKFSDGPEKCIAATDAAGNHILMPHSDELEEILQAWFGYEKTDEPPFDAQAEFDKTEYGKAA